jgi:hypothetical protein
MAAAAAAVAKCICRPIHQLQLKQLQDCTCCIAPVAWQTLLLPLLLFASTLHLLCVM